MGNLELTIIFFMSLSITIYFFGRLFTWGLWKINPSSFESEPISENQINIACILQLIANIGWSLIFYHII